MIGLLGSLLGGRGGSTLGRMFGGRNGAMMGGLVGSLLGGSQIRKLGGLFKGKGDKDKQDDAAELDEVQAEVLVRAMCNAAKADGHVDDDEARMIVSELGDEVSDVERDFLKRELKAPAMSASDMASSVPETLRAEAYAVSLLAINVDTVEEAEYLKDLASALGIADDQRDSIHRELAPAQ